MGPIVNEESLDTEKILIRAMTLCLGGPAIGIAVGAFSSYVSEP